MISDSKKEQKEMKHFIMQCNFPIFILFFVPFLLFTSCRSDIDSKIKHCYYTQDSIFWMSDLYPEEWDTLFYFSGAYSLEDVAERVGPNIYNRYVDVGRRLMLVDKRGIIVYYKEYFVNYGQKSKSSSFFLSENSKMWAIPRDKAKFLIRKREDNSFWVYWIGDDNNKENN